MQFKMSDVEKALSGLTEDEELLQQQHQQQQQQQSTATPITKVNTNANNINSYNLKNETGSHLQQAAQQHQHHQQHKHQLQQQQYQLQQQQQQKQHYITDTKYLGGGNTNCGHSRSNNKSSKTNNNNNNNSTRTCLSRVLKLIFSTPGLVVMVIVYTIMGAFMFPLLEAPQDISKSAIIAKSREECLKELWIITEKLNVLYERNWTMLVHEQLRRFEGTIVAATRNMANGGGGIGGGVGPAGASTGSASASSSGIGGSGMGGGSGAGNSAVGMAADTSSSSTTTALGRFGGGSFIENGDFTATRWSFSEALLYSVTVITTIGHGSLTPRTAGGKIATILYALIGVPLMLMCLSSLGAILAEALQCTYARLCCRWPQYMHSDGNNHGDDDDDDDDDCDDDDDGLDDNGGIGPEGIRSNVVVDDCDVLDGTGADDVMMQKCQQRTQKHRRNRGRRRQRRRQGDEQQRRCQKEMTNVKQCSFQDHKHGINCKNCKYDAVMGDGNAAKGMLYDYKMDVKEKQLTAAGILMASPTKHAMKEVKFNQQQQLNNSCMQLKMSSTATTMATTTPATSQQQQQQQQQQLFFSQQSQQSYFQQRPDVMLMATGHKLSSPPTIGSATACRMLMTNTASNAGSNPPRYYSPPMATYHIVSSASANSSPTHQQSIRHYIIPPPPSVAGSQTAMGTQHFMAVPSNMLRFQASPLHCSNAAGSTTSGITSNISINPLASGATTTVFFPIVTPAAPAQNPLALPGTSSGGNVTSAANGATTTNSTYSASTPLGTSSSATSSSGLTPMVKYHTIQMPHRRKQTLSLSNCDTQDNENVDEMLPPPPPAYQTATVHGIRRAKFLTKPLPQEINNILHESDISCRHDLSTQLNLYTSGGEQPPPQQQQHHHQQQTYQQQQQSLSTMPSMASTMATTSHSVTGATDMATETTQQQQQHHHQQLQYNQYQHQQQPHHVNNLYNNTSTICATSAAAQASNSSSLATATFTHSPSVLPSSVVATTTTTTSTMANTNNMCNSSENHESPSPLPLTQMSPSQHHSHPVTATHCSTASPARVGSVGGSAGGGGLSAVVDIMDEDDDEEMEQQHLGNCPHGTPSRIPLLTCSTATSTHEDKSSARSFLHATAASIQRHTQFHRTTSKHHQPAVALGPRKSLIINRKGECNLHVPQKRRNSTICYRDTTMDTSEDDEYFEGENMYKLQHLHAHTQQTEKLRHSHSSCYEDADNSSLVSYGSASTTSQLPQVPMLVVLFILVFYVCMGTVIFALWENWSLIDGAYFCFVTLTTIGYGDFVPLRTFQGPEIQLFACCAYLLLGLVLVAMSFSILETQLIWKCKRLAVRLKLAKE